MCLCVLYKLLIKKETFFQIVFDLLSIKMSDNIFGSGSNLIKPQQGPPEEGFKLLDEEGNYDMPNKRLANVATSIENHDCQTKSKCN